MKILKNIPNINMQLHKLAEEQYARMQAEQKAQLERQAFDWGMQQFMADKGPLVLDKEGITTVLGLKNLQPLLQDVVNNLAPGYRQFLFSMPQDPEKKGALHVTDLIPWAQAILFDTLVKRSELQKTVNNIRKLMNEGNISYDPNKKFDMTALLIVNNFRLDEAIQPKSNPQQLLWNRWISSSWWRRKKPQIEWKPHQRTTAVIPLSTVQRSQIRMLSPRQVFPQLPIRGINPSVARFARQNPAMRRQVQNSMRRGLGLGVGLLTKGRLKY